MSDLYGIEAFAAEQRIELPAHVLAVLEPILLWQREAEPCARIPIVGWIDRRAGVPGLPGTPPERIRAHLQSALADDQVRAILLEVDSGGGSFPGIDELADEIRAARARKVIVAHGDSRMESGAYWLASASSRVFASSRCQVGAVGVVHQNGQVSVPGKPSLAWRKTRHSGDPDSSEQREAIQRVVDRAHARFVSSIMLGRGCTYARAAAMGTGIAYPAREALTRGFLDGICSRVDAIRLALEFAGARAAPGAEQRTGLKP